MRTVDDMLKEAEPALLPLLAQRWGVDSTGLSAAEMTAKLATAMQDTDRAEKIYDALDEKARGALQTLVGSGKKMNARMFEQMFGEIRKMGAGRIEKERPHENPISPAEALYYRGLIAHGMDKVGVGIGPTIYIPEDLADMLPTHKTGYSAEALERDAPQTTAEAAPTGGTAAVYPIDDVENVKQADTSIVDDLTTLLAYLQSISVEVDPEGLLQEAPRESVLAHLIVQDAHRLDFLMQLGVSAGLIEIQNARAFPKRAEVRRWLDDKRSVQLKWLADAWRESLDYRDLWHTPGLHPDPTGWPYNPAAARKAMLELMTDLVPRQAWWSLDEFILAIRDENPDFQRPGGDYESWYIRNDDGEYLNGIESWDAVEGALLEFYLMGPMHWLALADLAEDAARLTAYGRAFIDESQPWPDPADTPENIVILEDGTMHASRKVTRIDRFQLARFTAWESPATRTGDPYVYRLTAAGIQRAEEQGINTGHIAAFINRVLDNGPVPAAISNLLKNWQSGPTASVTLEQMIVIRTTAPETLDYIADTPALRRYMGARLGPMAAAVRPDQWEAFREALGNQGIDVEILF